LGITIGRRSSRDLRRRKAGARLAVGTMKNKAAIRTRQNAIAPVGRLSTPTPSGTGMVTPSGLAAPQSASCTASVTFDVASRAMKRRYPGRSRRTVCREACETAADGGRSLWVTGACIFLGVKRTRPPRTQLCRGSERDPHHVGKSSGRVGSTKSAVFETGGRGRRREASRGVNIVMMTPALHRPAQAG